MTDLSVKKGTRLSRPTPSQASYAAKLRGRMHSRQNSHGRQLSIRDLAAAAGCSYEHTRKVLAGEPVVSPRLNEALCTVLLLDPTQMWQTAGAEKLKRKAKSLGMIAMGSLGIPFIREWRILDQDQRDAIETVVRVMARRDAPGQTKPRDGFVSGEEMNPMQMPVIERTPDRRA